MIDLKQNSAITIENKLTTSDSLKQRLQLADLSGVEFGKVCVSKHSLLVELLLTALYQQLLLTAVNARTLHSAAAAAAATHLDSVAAAVSAGNGGSQMQIREIFGPHPRAVRLECLRRRWRRRLPLHHFVARQRVHARAWATLRHDRARQTSGRRGASVAAAFAAEGAAHTEVLLSEAELSVALVQLLEVPHEVQQRQGELRHLDGEGRLLRVVYIHAAANTTQLQDLPARKKISSGKEDFSFQVKF